MLQASGSDPSSESGRTCRYICCTVIKDKAYNRYNGIIEVTRDHQPKLGIPP
jgi:hypothetical protein